MLNRRQVLMRNRGQKCRIDRVVGTVQLNQRSHAANAGPLAGNLNRTSNDQLSARGGDCAQPAFCHHDSLVEDGDKSFFDAEWIGKAGEYKPCVAHAHVAGDQHRLTKSRG